ncbi:MAG TPA: universal stress protein [Geminicoccaceae bacterium]|nr:universal stress protein [Geminicoccaceae bacterium]
MSIKRIIVPILGADPDRTTLQTALAVARRFGGHVAALYRPFRHDRDDNLRNLRRLPPAYFEGFHRQLEEASWAHAEQSDAGARRVFDEVIAEGGVAHAEAPPAAGGQPSASWRTVEEPLPEAVAHHGGVADLVGVGRPGGDAEEKAQATVEAALFGSACPVLVAPPGGAGQLGERVLIGWNRTIPSQRAVAGAMPFLERAREVAVFGVATGAKTGPSPQEVAEHLAWHGVQARVREIPPDQRAVGQALLDEAREMGADLLVMGAFSHSRLRATLLGGVTSYVLTHAELPVLMAH